MFSKFKKVLVSLVLASSLALAPLSSVSAMPQPKGLPVHQYYKITKVANELGITDAELSILNSLSIITYLMVYNCNKTTINKSKVLTRIDNMLTKPTGKSSSYVKAHTSTIITIRDKITKKLQDEQA